MNMRKIIAVLAAVLLLCAAIPMGAMSVSAAGGDVALSANFDNGLDGFQSDVSLSNDGGYLTFNAPGASWVTAYTYASGIKANTEYDVTFKAKADKDGQLGVQVKNGWGDTVYKEFVDVTTEWQDYTLKMSGLALTETALFMFLSNYDASVAPIFYIDDVNVVEYEEPAVPGQLINGDFETGDNTGWNLPQNGGVSADAAHDGSYGVHIKGNGGWGGMLDQTFPVNAGKAYEITFWAQANANGVNFQIKDGDTSGTNLTTAWIDTKGAGSWKQFTYIVSPTQDTMAINFCGGGTGSAEDAYVDSFTCVELIDPSFDGYVTNGDFETGKTDSWENLQASNTVELVEGMDSNWALKFVAGGQWTQIRQKINVTPNTNYVVRVNHKNTSGMTLLVKSGDDSTNIKQVGLNSGDNWTVSSGEFNSGSNSVVSIGLMGNGVGDGGIFDNVTVFEKVEASNDGYIINGTFETGDLTPWYSLWGSASAEIVKDGKDSNWAVQVACGKWQHVRQVNIAVEPNTDYKISAWAKNASGMSLLIKGISTPETSHGNAVETGDIKNVGVSADDEWTLFEGTFNSGDHSYVLFSLMGNTDGECYGTFDDIKMEYVGEHVYELSGGEFATCDTDGTAVYTCACGDSYEETITAYHNGNMEYTPAKDAIDCQNPGNIEYYYCPGCYEYFADANATEILNPWFIEITVDCVRPEDAADCAIVPCEVCGNDTYGYGEHDVVACQGGVCGKCGDTIEGYGCQNYDTPNCEDGVCYYCGGFVAGYGHENGNSWAPCLEGECAYGCGLTYPATADHVDADGDDFCDTCYGHLAHVDEDGNNECDICWAMMPVVEIVYGDANGDSEITAIDAMLLQQYIAGYEVTMNETSADANGDGEITAIDAMLLQQYIAGYDVTLGG